MKPRDYQIDAVKAAHHKTHDYRRLLVISPTASGKSVMIAMIVDAIMKEDALMDTHTRILVLCHQGHLLTQNEAQIKKFGDYDTGVFCAGEGRKEYDNQIVLASRDSLANNVHLIGHRDLVLCDEAHMIEPTVLNEENKTQYSKICRPFYESKFIGFTGTPWRLGNGKIWGHGSFFQKVAYNIGMDMLISEGYLCPYVFPDYDVKTIDASNVRKSRGDFVATELEKISSTHEVVAASIDKWNLLASDRKISLFFCCGVTHANLVSTQLEKYLSPDEILLITGETVGEERREEFEKIKTAHYKAIVNVGVLTTGFDAPMIDCIVLLRATASASLYVQMIGRGLRIAEGKDNCLILDMAANYERFKSIENPFIEEKEPEDEKEESENKIKGIGKQKTCPECMASVPIATKVCGFCLHIFITHDDNPETLKPKILESDIVQSFVHKSKTRAGESCYIFEVWTSYNYKDKYKKWLLHERPGPFGDKARKYLESIKTKTPTRVKIDFTRNEKFPEIEIVEWQNDLTYLCHHTHVEPFKNSNGQYNYRCLDCGEIK